MKKFLSAYTNIGGKVCYYLCFASMAMIAVMMLLMFADAMLGIAFNTRILGAYELIQCMLLILVFSSWAYTQTVHGHINVVMFIRMMPNKVRFSLYALTSLLSTVTMAFASYAAIGALIGKMSNGEATATLLIPYWPLYLFMLAAFVLMALVLLCDALKAIVAIFDQETADEITATWV